ncbi:hypothetical protein AAFF_G00107800 [Aldrovandia affinis]|uniref:Uncharacterized protein n=1 Tax=Aldrovandia affinis TaxID=143900 RepID=A0AAD7WAW7_9TELE|nr:hypothetical protein AAFF_G00107800 [Aldrovandia affinis]
MSRSRASARQCGAACEPEQLRLCDSLLSPFSGQQRVGVWRAGQGGGAAGAPGDRAGVDPPVRSDPLSHRWPFHRHRKGGDADVRGAVFGPPACATLAPTSRHD